MTAKVIFYHRDSDFYIYMMKYLQFFAVLFFVISTSGHIAVAQTNLITVKVNSKTVSVDPSTMLHSAMKATGHDGKQNVY